MSAMLVQNNGPRKRVSGILKSGGRGLNILTDAGELWVIEGEDADPELLGRRVTAEGVQTGYDRLQVEWLGEAQG